MITAKAYARAGFLGNPSDGYNGKTISISVRNFKAVVTLSRSEYIKIEAGENDTDIYGNLKDLTCRINLYGYYGGVRLIKAAIKTFYNFCMTENIELEDKNFTIGYTSDIPRQVGLGGSSAIITAVMRVLMEYYDVDISRDILPSLILSAEKNELGINAGFQDRVIQVLEGCLYMDFSPEAMKKKKSGIYERIDTSRLPELYIAYKTDLSKVSGQALSDVRTKFDNRDKVVIKTLNRIAGIAGEGKQAILEKDTAKLHNLINENFDLRKKIMKISEENIELVETARKYGASAKFAGSGGSIIGTYKGENMFDRLKTELGKINARVIKPDII